ncbi:histidine phosphatase family protein [Nonomuraea rubra]|uniref:histidine phosphatase family protein n=1 Tax=Nonomuraea rubra TaxID=46180 RepID=UPI0033C4E5CA
MLFIRHATTPGMRAAGFPGDGDADPASLARAAALRPLVVGREAWVSPARAARQTALAMGLEPRVCAALGEADCGRWRGLPYERVAREEPEALARWLSDPHAAPHGGESPAAFADRVAAWLATTREPTQRDTPTPWPASPPPDRHAPGSAAADQAAAPPAQAEQSASPPEPAGQPAPTRAPSRRPIPVPLVVVCDAGVIRAVLGHALGLGPMAAARFDLAPLSATELIAARDGWRVAYVNRKV